MERRKVWQLLTAGSVGSVLGIRAAPLRQAIADGEVETWGYVGEKSPEYWSDLSSTYRVCRVGKQPSPIDLRRGSQVGLAAIDIRYESIPLLPMEMHFVHANAKG
ncbi:MAG: hypothetical protein ACFBSF_11570 [Leptolyngbyaceae cyanobacterium]